MRHKNCLKTISPLLEKPFFSSKEAKTLGVSAAVLNYYVQTGVLKKVSRSIYQAVSTPFPSLGRWHDLIEAVYSTTGGIVCLISALAIYDLTEEIPRQHWIGIRHGSSAKKHGQTKIIRFRNIEIGRTEIELEGVKIPIFDRERTIIDAFRLLSREIAMKALKIAMALGGKNRLDLKKLESYAKKLRFNIDPYLLSMTT